MAVLYTGLERFSHLLMPFHPPRQPHISEADFAMYQQGLSVVYQLHDMMLGRLIELAGQDTTIIVISDHGFKTGMGRCDKSPIQSIEATIASHDSQGIVVMRGPHIIADDTIEGTTVLDIAPTILTLLGLPVAADMDGRPMHGAFDVPVTVDCIPSWDHVKSDRWQSPREPATQFDERLRYLTDLGYSESPAPEARKRIDQTCQDNTYNLARSLMDARETERAIPLLESLSRKSPYAEDLNKSLFEAYSEAGRPEDARKIVQRFWDAGERGPLVHLGFALVSLTQRRPEEALDHLNKIPNRRYILPGMQILIGRAYLRLREWDLAEHAFRTELALNNNNELAWGGLAVAAAGKEHYQAAAEHALQAVGLKPDYIEAHYQLGVSLYRLGRHGDAANAFKRCLEIDPAFIAACRALMGLYQGELYDPQQALAYQRHAADCLKHRHHRRSPRPPMPPARVAASSMSYEPAGLERAFLNGAHPASDQRS
jgi:tetratricopeptide (TPR) repeat protein